VHEMLTKFVVIGLLLVATVNRPAIAEPLKVGVAGLSHDHAHGLMRQHKDGKVIILGIAEPDARLADRYMKQYQLPASLFFPSLKAMLDKIKPEAVLAYNAISEHLAVVEQCAPKGIHVMVEKPLAFSMKDAARMKSLADQYHVQLLVNYETTWYASNQSVYSRVRNNEIGAVKKMVVHDGHNGPKEIGCSQDFLSWLTDPDKNGGGAIIDFGCYGANLMTWLMEGKAPIAVTAITRRFKPDLYPKVDDDATIIVEYEGATGIIEASWNWPYGIKDLEVFGQRGYLQAVNGKMIRSRFKTEYELTEAPPPAYTDNLDYFAAVLKGEIKTGNDLSSLENNMIVVKILDAAIRSSKEGKRIEIR
jgi:predicted dehydrogenase